MTGRGTAASIRAAIAAGILGSVGACELQQLDAVTAPRPDAGGDESPGTALSGGPTDAASDAPVDASNTACSALAPVIEWTFDTSNDGWMITSSQDARATTSWTGAIGNPAPGALELDVGDAAPDANGLSVVWVYKEISAVDLTGGTVSAWVLLDRGPSPQLLSFVQTAPAEAWGDNGEIQIPQGIWTCLSIAVSSPVTTQGQYEPAQVIKIGFEMIGAPFRLLIDSVRAE